MIRMIDLRVLFIVYQCFSFFDGILLNASDVQIIFQRKNFQQQLALPQNFLGEERQKQNWRSLVGYHIQMWGFLLRGTCDKKYCIVIQFAVYYYVLYQHVEYCMVCVPEYNFFYHVC
eukprot:TRINITY_DN38356_c0_g2_i5.p5 TRINITY_DN38356_c0_g2~~TRINITY_DN38356_c0_g2_i5.p5  ORF type:complete len:117 (-),score=10.62 TRINITY_DN38356_c0_g2_i5:176-526(-)